MCVENETQVFASKYKLYLPSEEELLNELKQEMQIFEIDKSDEDETNFPQVVERLQGMLNGENLMKLLRK
jgi:thioredoxin-related protein